MISDRNALIGVLVCTLIVAVTAPTIVVCVLMLVVSSVLLTMLLVSDIK